MKEQGSGSIVLFSFDPLPGSSSLAKGSTPQPRRASCSWRGTFAAELGPAGVRVNAVAPGVVATPLTQPIRDQPDWNRAYAEKSVFGRWARPEEMAGPTLFSAQRSGELRDPAPFSSRMVAGPRRMVVSCRPHGRTRHRRLGVGGSGVGGSE